MSAANGGVWTRVAPVAHFNLTPEFYVDGLICYHRAARSGFQLNLTTRMVANQTINIKRLLASGRNAQPDLRLVRERPFSPLFRGGQ